MGGSVAVASLGPSLLPFSLPNVGSVKRCVFFILFLFSFTLPFPSSVFILSLVRWRSLKEQRVVIIGIHRTDGNIMTASSWESTAMVKIILEDFLYFSFLFIIWFQHLLVFYLPFPQCIS